MPFFNVLRATGSILSDKKQMNESLSVIMTTKNRLEGFVKCLPLAELSRMQQNITEEV